MKPVRKTSRSDVLNLAVSFKARLLKYQGARRVSDDWIEDFFNRRWRDAVKFSSVFRALKDTAKFK